MSKPWVEVLGIAFMLAFSITFAAIFANALANGGETTVYINKYNEMWVEAVVFYLIAMPTIAVGLHRYAQ